MFLQADYFVQGVMLFLVIMSIYSWGIIFEKIFLLRSIRNEYAAFNQLLQDNDYNIRTIEQKHFALIKKLNIFGEIILTIYNCICTTKERQIDESALLKDIDLKIQEINSKIESKLYILSSISGAAPFIGLLGTVWRIMNSFQSIVFMKNASITAVAPGIAEALLATALGLVVAIPALIFNNKFYSDLENFNLKFNASFVRLVKKLEL
jgi:biopolymer transport protein TolQ